MKLGAVGWERHYSLPFWRSRRLRSLSASRRWKARPSLVIAALRLTFATLLLSPIALIRQRGEISSLSRNEWILGLASGLFLAVHFATWISSLEYTSVASSVVFVSTGPLWVALLSPLLLNERLQRAAVIGLALALFGGTVVGLSDACA